MNFIYQQPNVHFGPSIHSVTATVSGVYLDNCIIHQLRENYVCVWNVEHGTLETISLPLNDKSIIYYQELVIKYYVKERNINKHFENNYIDLKKKYDLLLLQQKKVKFTKVKNVSQRC